MATKSKTPRGRAAQRRRAVQQQVRAPRVALDDSERQPCEVWTRVMGYHRPVAGFNAGKQAEHAERRFFKLPESERLR